MIIGIDIQALQTENSRNRGIGRYSNDLLMALLNSDDSFILFSNANYKDQINVSNEKNRKIIPINYTESKLEADNTVNHILQFLEYRSHHLDIFHVMSPFEGHPYVLPVMNPYFDRLVCVVCSTVYDLIPMRFPRLYFQDPNFKKVYYRQLKTLYNSDILFAISAATRTDLINFLGFNPNRVINIEAGSSASFQKIENLSSKIIINIKKKYGIKNKFVLYPAGIDFRKNIEKSIISFSKIEKSLIENVSYVIVCKISELDKKHLYDLASNYKVEENLVLTGYIPDEDLNILYNCCDSLLFPSLSEGFGLPILEAMKCGAPVIGSNVNGIAELIEDDNYMFNPENENEISDLIQKILQNMEFRKQSVTHSINKSKNYSWENVANKVLDTYKSQYLKKSVTFHKKIKKPSIAYFSPIPPNKSGIANYSSILLPFLSKYWDIDIFIDGYTTTEPYLQSNFDIYYYKRFEALNNSKNYDEIIYHVGNSDNHSYMFDMIKKYPGIVVLHDVFISGIIQWMTARVGKLDEFIEEVIYSHGNHGKELVNMAKKNIIPWDSIVWDLPMSRRVINQAKKVIVHSNWDREIISKHYPDLIDKVSIIPHFSKITINDKKIDKTVLGFSQDDFLICTFGFVVSTKKIDSIIENLANFLKNNSNCKFVIVGDFNGVYAESVRQVINRLGLSDKVKLTGFIDEFQYQQYLGICDVCIQLRKNFRGGGSGTVNHALGAGLPIIVTDDGSFSEFPDDIIIKIKQGEEKIF